MAVLGRLLVSSAERLDLPDFLSIDSFTQGDIKYLMRSFVGEKTPYILTGFDIINPGATIGTQNVSIRVADSVVYFPGSLAGPFFHGLGEGNAQSAPLIPELRKNSTNYVYLTFTTTEAAKDTRAFWDPDKEGGIGGEFTQDVNTQTVLTVVANVSVSAFPENTIPVCKVVVGANFIDSVEDARDMMFRLGTGGLSPNPLARYNWRPEPSTTYERAEPNILITNALDPNPFQGGDKNIQSLKEWMDAVMTKLAELGGTTYWYEDTSVYSLINVFKDALATSIKSKGFWNSSSGTPGLLTWSEDMLIQSTSDSSEFIVRAGSETLANDEVMFIDRVRDVPINTGSISVEWFNAVNHVNGQLGSFENLSKGDWIKKSDDADNLYLRVEEFYAAENKGGGVTAPGNALSIQLSEVYGGLSETKQGVYIKGVYLSSEVKVEDRASTAIQTAAGNYYWLAMRSDTILDISDITSTQLSLDITDHDGSKAKVTSAAHGLADGQQITIVGSTNFDNTYAVSVESANVFYIDVTGGPHADEAAQTAFYATITTAARNTAFGLQLESANHGLSRDQKVVISDTTNYNGDFSVYPTGNTTFTIPVNSLIANETSGTNTAVNIYVRTDIGPTKLERGENKTIGEVDTNNMKAFLGMDNDAQTYPKYYVTPSYNTINGYENYNSDSTDNVTERLSKLTSMMADRSQDKMIKFLPSDTDRITNTTNAAAQEITFTSVLGNTPTLNITLPNSDNSGTLALDTTVSLLANQAAYVDIDRNDGFTIAAPTVASIKDLPLGENIFIVAVRLSTTDVYIWDTTIVPAGEIREYQYTEKTIVRQNLNAKMIAGGTWNWNLTTNLLTWDSDAYIQVPGLANARNTLQAGSISLIADGQTAYVNINRETGAVSNLTVNTSAIASLSLNDPDIVVVARRVGDEVLVGTSSFALKDESFLELDGASAEINRRHQQLIARPSNPIDNKVRINGSDILQLSGSQLSLEQRNLLLDFNGAVIDFTTGKVFETDGVTPLLGGASDFTPAVIGANEYFYYSVSIIPNVTNADNTIVGQILITPATGSDAVLANAPKAPFPSSGLSVGLVYVQEDGAAGILDIDYANITLLSATGGGTGSGLTKADLHDPLTTVLPTGVSVIIDGVTGVDDDLVLFTNLTTGNNKIYKLSGVGVAIAWEPTLDFNLGTPEDGDAVIIRDGASFREALGIFDGTDWKFNDTVRYYSGADYWEQSSLKSSDIIASTTDNIFVVTLAGSENFIVDYSILRGGAKETGTVIITSDGTSVDVSRTSANVGIPGVDLFADISGSNIRFRYTADVGANGTIKYSVKRWSNAAGGPGGIASYSGSIASPISAAGSISDVQYHSAAGNLSGDNNFQWNETNATLDLGDVSVSAMDSSAVVINDNQITPANLITLDATSIKFAVIEYSMERNGESRMGRLQVCHNGTVSVFTEDSVDTGGIGISDTEIVLSSSLVGSNLFIKYTSTSTGFAGTFKFSTRRWQ